MPLNPSPAAVRGSNQVVVAVVQQLCILAAFADSFAAGPIRLQFRLLVLKRVSGGIVCLLWATLASGLVSAIMALFIPSVVGFGSVTGLASCLTCAGWLRFGCAPRRRRLRQGVLLVAAPAVPS